MDTKNTPKLRFPGFSDEWEEKKLKDIADFRRGSFPQPYGLAKWYDTDGAPFVQVYDVANDFRLKPTTKRHISIAAQKMSVRIPKGSLIITIQGSIGRVAITQYDAYVDRTLLFIRGTKIELSIKLLSYMLFLKFEGEKRKAPGGTIKTITKEALGSFKLQFPMNSDEQNKIAGFLGAVDDKIAALQGKKELLEKYKKGVMQKIFPLDSEQAPEIRFSGFIEHWQETMLDWVVKKISTGLNPRDNFVLGTGDKRYITIKNINSGNLDFDKAENIDDSAKRLINQRSSLAAKDIIMASIGNVGDAYLLQKNPDDWDINESVFALKPDHTRVLSEFLYFFITMDETQKRMETMSTGSSFRSIKMAQLKSMSIKIPSIDEQEKIAEFLTSLDDKIEAEERKLDQAKQFKKALLQQMFV